MMPFVVARRFHCSETRRLAPTCSRQKDRCQAWSRTRAAHWTVRPMWRRLSIGILIQWLDRHLVNDQVVIPKWLLFPENSDS